MGLAEDPRALLQAQSQYEVEATLSLQKQMMPIWQEQFEQELVQQKKLQELELEQTEALYLLAQRLEEENKPEDAFKQPIYVTQQAAATKQPNYLVLAGLLIAFLFLRGKK